MFRLKHAKLNRLNWVLIAAIGVVYVYLTHTTHTMAFDFCCWQLND